LGALSSREQRRGVVWNFDVDLERRDGVAAIHPDHDVVAIDRDVAGDHRDDLLAQDSE